MSILAIRCVRNRWCSTGASRTRIRDSASSPGTPRASTRTKTISSSISNAPISCASGTRKAMPYITEERRMIQEQAREFTLNEVLPVANKLDPEKGDIPMDLRDKMAELGYFGILIPEKYGGLGLGCFEYCLVTEELSRGWMSVASLIARGN